MPKKVQTTLLAACATLVLGCHNKPEPRVVPPAPDFQSPPVAKTVDVETPASTSDRRLLPVDAVYFELDSDELSPHGKELLSSVAEWMEATPDAEVIIEGYADHTGPRRYNLWLSHKRADAVARYLENEGVPIQRMQIYALGERNGDTRDRSADRQVRIYAEAASAPPTSG